MKHSPVVFHPHYNLIIMANIWFYVPKYNIYSVVTYLMNRIHVIWKKIWQMSPTQIIQKKSFTNVPSKSENPEENWLVSLPSQKIQKKMGLVSLPSQKIQKKMGLVSLPSQIIQKKMGLMSLPSQKIQKKMGLVSLPSQIVQKKMGLVSLPSQIIQKKMGLVSLPSQIIQKKMGLVFLPNWLKNVASYMYL